MTPNHFYYGIFTHQVVFGPFGGLGGSTPEKKPVSKRDRDIENDVGNYLITAYQMHRLEERLAGRILSSPKSSEVMFRNDSGRWIRVSINVESFDIPSPIEEPKKDPNPNNNNVPLDSVYTGIQMPYFLASTGQPSAGSEGAVSGTSNTVMASGEWVEWVGLPRTDCVAELDSEDPAP